MASFSCAGRLGTPVRPWGAPSRKEVKIEGSTSSFNATDFSDSDDKVSFFKGTINYVTYVRPSIRIQWGRRQFGNLRLTADGTVLNAKELGFVVARDCGVSVDVSRQHWEAGGHVRSSHPFFSEFLLIWMLFHFLYYLLYCKVMDKEI